MCQKSFAHLRKRPLLAITPFICSDSSSDSDPLVPSSTSAVILLRLEVLVRSNTSENASSRCAFTGPRIASTFRRKVTDRDARSALSSGGACEVYRGWTSRQPTSSMWRGVGAITPRVSDLGCQAPHTTRSERRVKALESRGCKYRLLCGFRKSYTAVRPGRCDNVPGCGLEWAELTDSAASVRVLNLHLVQRWSTSKMVAFEEEESALGSKSQRRRRRRRRTTLWRGQLGKRVVVTRLCHRKL